jgi:hypothetical protein
LFEYALFIKKKKKPPKRPATPAALGLPLKTAIDIEFNPICLTENACNEGIRPHSNSSLTLWPLLSSHLQLGYHLSTGGVNKLLIKDSSVPLLQNSPTDRFQHTPYTATCHFHILTYSSSS